MTRFARWSVLASAAVVSASGMVYLWIKYFLTPSDPFSVVNHPLQPVLLQVHLLAGPPLIALFGMVLQSHVLGKIRSGCRRNRRSGFLAVGTFGVMAMSGYLLQVLTAPWSLTLAWWSHVGSGVAFALTYAAHVAIGLRVAAGCGDRVVDSRRLVSSVR